MRLVRTQGRGGGQTRQMLSELEQRGARNMARAMPVVGRIVEDVRKGGDQVLRRYGQLHRIESAVRPRHHRPELWNLREVHGVGGVRLEPGVRHRIERSQLRKLRGLRLEQHGGLHRDEGGL